MSHYVIIDGERFFVADDRAMDAVRAELLAAVHAGGAFVALGGHSAGYTEVLVTGSSVVRIEHVTVEPAAPADDAEQQEWGADDHEWTV